MSMMKSVGPPPHLMLMPLLVPSWDVKLFATTTPPPALTFEVRGPRGPLSAPGAVTLLGQSVPEPSSRFRDSGTRHEAPGAWGVDTGPGRRLLTSLASR